MYDDMLAMWKRYRHVARRAGQYSSSPALVAKAMQRLNQHAHQRHSGRDVIYALKSALLRYWYQRGLLVHVARVRQVLTCNACGGDGWEGDWKHGDLCRRCSGTGIWREYWLLELTYDIEGQRYTFHQPQHLVTYLHGIVPVESEKVIRGTITSERQVSAEFAEICYCVIAAALPGGFTRPYMRRRDLWWMWWHETDAYFHVYRLRQKWYRFTEALQERIFNLTGYSIRPSGYYDDIPF